MRFLFQSHRLGTFRTRLFYLGQLCFMSLPWFLEAIFHFHTTAVLKLLLFQLSVWRGSINNYVKGLNRPIAHAASREEEKRWLIPHQCQFSHMLQPFHIMIYSQIRIFFDFNQLLVDKKWHLKELFQTIVLSITSTKINEFHKKNTKLI